MACRRASRTWVGGVNLNWPFSDKASAFHCASKSSDMVRALPPSSSNLSLLQMANLVISVSVGGGISVGVSVGGDISVGVSIVAGASVGAGAGVVGSCCW